MSSLPLPIPDFAASLRTPNTSDGDLAVDEQIAGILAGTRNTGTHDVCESPVMTAYGERYIDLDRFMRYCQSLNISTSEQELEHYEKIGAMLPVARVIYPRDYLIQQRTSTLEQPPSVNATSPSPWPEIDRLFDKNFYFIRRLNDVTDEDLIDSFDREMGNNSLLTRPSPADFRPWADYIVQIPDGRGPSLRESSAKHYYDYWQVHQLFLIRKSPELYKIKWLIDLLPDAEKAKRPHLENRNMEPFVNFHKKRPLYNALSFWLTMYSRERQRTFAEIPEAFGSKRLDATQADAYWSRLEDHAKLVMHRFTLTVDDLYKFLNQLLRLLTDYERDEKTRLGNETKQDIFEVAHFINCAVGHQQEKIEQQLAKHSGHSRTFRHLFRHLKERDYAVDIIQYIVEHPDNHGDIKQSLGWGDVDLEINSLLDYCETKGLAPLFTSLSGMVAIGEEERREKFRRVERYGNLKSALTSYEYFIRGIGENVGLHFSGNTLRPVLNAFMDGEPWMQQFRARAKRGFTSARNGDEFAQNLTNIQSDPALKGFPIGFWAGTFLLVCLARNYTVHHYPSEDVFYNEPYGDILHSMVLALCYTWKVAKIHGWT